MHRRRVTSSSSRPRRFRLAHRRSAVSNLCPHGTLFLSRLRKNADGWSFRGAGFAREPEIHEHGLMKSMVWPVFLDSGPAPKAVPGMTAKFFRALLRALWPKGSLAPRRTTSRAL